MHAHKDSKRYVPYMILILANVRYGKHKDHFVTDIHDAANRLVLDYTTRAVVASDGHLAPSLRLHRTGRHRSSNRDREEGELQHALPHHSRVASYLCSPVPRWETQQRLPARDSGEIANRRAQSSYGLTVEQAVSTIFRGL